MLECAPTDLVASSWVNEMVNFSFHVLYYRVEALLPEMQEYPGCSVLGLDTEDGPSARQEMLAHLKILLQVEDLAYSHAGLDRILKTVGPWKNNSMVRLLLFALELEATGLSELSAQGPLIVKHEHLEEAGIVRVHTRHGLEHAGLQLGGHQLVHKCFILIEAHHEFLPCFGNAFARMGALVLFPSLCPKMALCPLLIVVEPVVEQGFAVGHKPGQNLRTLCSSLL